MNVKQQRPKNFGNLLEGCLHQRITSKPFNYNLHKKTDVQIQMLTNSVRLKNPDNKPSCGCVNALAWSTDYSHIVSGCDNSMVQLWNVNSNSLVKTLYGHSTNVFCVQFLKDYSIEEIASGGNDADIRFYNMKADTCTTISHFSRKVLSMCKHPNMPNTIIACSADGTVRLFDTRVRYEKTKIEALPTQSSHGQRVIPQAFGGGRESRDSDEVNKESLLVNYRSRARRSNYTLYSVDIHPLNGQQIIVGSGLGDVRCFDLRKIRDYDAMDYVNIYKNSLDQAEEPYEVTGCQFSYNGSEIVATFLGDQIYVFDTEPNATSNSIDNSNDINPSQCSSTNNEFDTAAALNTTQESSYTSFNNDDRDVEEEEDLDLDHLFFQRLLQFRNNKSNEQNNAGSSNHSNDRTLYKMKYEGHISRDTIKGVAFYGDHSQYVISGSDDSNVFIWKKETGRLIRILSAHSDTVNTICPSRCPLTRPMIATSGIDDYINIWTPNDEYPNDEQLEAREKLIQDIAKENRRRPSPGLIGDANLIRDIMRELYFGTHGVVLLRGESNEEDEEE
jgi:WD40 repeat protein